MATGRTVQPIARQACDACRVRKRRCDLPVAVSSSSMRVLESDQDVSLRVSESRLHQCKRCQDLDMACTFQLPIATRGPRKKGSSTRGAKASTASAVLSRATPISEAHASQHSPTESSFDPSSNPMDMRSPLSSGRRPEMNVDSPFASQSSPQSVFSNQSFPVPHLGRIFPAESVCSRPLLNCIMSDYMDHLYPLIPVVHLPSFRQDLEKGRDQYDNDFFGLVVSLCAATVGIMPRKFNEYRKNVTPLRFVTRTEMVNHCYDVLLGLRGTDYFDEINLNKWASSYLVQIAFFQVGQHNRHRMVDVEQMQLARLLDFHQISSYQGLDCIQTQLRKKAFWLIFYGYVHSQLQHVRKERLIYLDGSTLSNINFQELMPVEVDDEMIHEDFILPQPANIVSLTTGFNIASRIFWASLMPLSSPDSLAANGRNCNCVLLKNPNLHLKYLRERLHDLKYMLDGVPPEFKQWATARDDITNNLNVAERRQRAIRRAQDESMRANIHVSHLWLQSIISDQVESLKQREPTSDSLDPVGSASKKTWPEREDICRQLLHVLHAIPEAHLEPNGHHLTYKIRDVALTLLACPFEPEDEVTRRAYEYLREFTNLLSLLDGSETINTLSLQSWVDTGRRVQRE